MSIIKQDYGEIGGGATSIETFTAAYRSTSSYILYTVTYVKIVDGEATVCWEGAGTGGTLTPTNDLLSFSLSGHTASITYNKKCKRNLGGTIVEKNAGDTESIANFYNYVSGISANDNNFSVYALE